MGGWRDRQLPDGTIIWMHGEPPTSEPADKRGAMMPKRRHTRAANTAEAKAAERKLNDAHVAQRTKPPPF